MSGGKDPGQGSDGRRRRWSRRAVGALAVAAAGALVFAGPTTPATAVGETLQVRLTQTDGTPSFDADDTAGHDSSDSNGIVRTNDNIAYNVEVNVNGGAATNTTFTLQLPQGTELKTIPPYCNQAPGTTPMSTLTPATLPQPGDAAEPLPITATSWTALPAQTLVCNVGNRTPNSTFTYPIVVKVRGEVPNGTTLSADVEAHTDDAPTPVTAGPLEATVSARAQYDLSKNGTTVDPDTGPFWSNERSCVAPQTGSCKIFYFSVLIAAPAGGKGNSPTSEFTFDENLDSTAFFGSAITSSPQWLAAGANANAQYGPFLSDCKNSIYDDRYQPFESVRSGTTSVNAVRSSGTMTCSQPGGPGTVAHITITNPDTTAATCPTTSANTLGAIPSDRCLVVSLSLGVQVPVETVTTFGVAAPPVDPTTWAMTALNRYENLQATDFGGAANRPEDESNNYRTIGLKVEVTPGFNKTFAGVPGDPLNTPVGHYMPGFPLFDGPPGNQMVHDGQITVLPGQGIVSSVYGTVTGAIGRNQDSTIVACDVWDNSQLWLKADDYGVSQYGAFAMGNGSAGAAVWIGGLAANGWMTWNEDPSLIPIPQVQYGHTSAPAGAGAASTCPDSVTWYSDPALVPGNDPIKASQGIYTGVNMVRAYATASPPGFDQTYIVFNIGQVVADDPGPLQTIIPNYGSTKIALHDHGTTPPTFAAMTADDTTYPWHPSNYSPADNSGSLGDRLIVASAYARIDKQVKGPYDASFGHSVPQASGGQTVQYQLSPTLTSPVPSALTRGVIVEDCLPAVETFLTSTPTASQAVVGSTPPGAGITCAAGETYLKWDLGQRTINAVIPPIVYSVRVGIGVSAGTYTNTTLITAEQDLSPIDRRQAEAQIQVVQPAGVFVDKTALTPIVQLNRADATTKEPQRWQVTFANINTSPGPTDVDLIDVLPQNGVNGLAFSGTYTLDSVTVTAGSIAGQPVEVLYSADANVSFDPRAASNAAATATTTWCNAMAGGTPVIGTGSCPTGPSTVKAFRLRRPGAFGPDALIQATVQITATGDQGGDIMVNRDGAAAFDLLTVGPVDAPETVVESSIGDYVWNDVDRDGVQDTGEPPAVGFRVLLSGTDDLGNNVSLSTTTDSSGKYLFGDLRAGTYTVTFDPTSLPAGTHFTFRNVAAGTPQTDSDGDVVTGQVTYTLAQGQDMADLDQGFFVMRPAITLKKYINGDDAQSAPGVAVPVGSTMNIRFDIANTGDVGLDPVTLTDDTIATADISCPATVLAVGAAMTCTATAPAPAPGVQHTNTATVTGHPPAYPDGTQLADVSATDPANAFTFEPAIEIVKYVLDTSTSAPTGSTADGQDSDADAAPGVIVGAAGTTTFEYEVTNTGTAPLDPVVVTDDKIANVSCPATSLAAGASMVCTATGPIPVGQYTNTATVVGTPPAITNPDGSVVQPDDVTDTDGANTFVPTSGIKLVKYVNDANPAAPTGRTGDGQDSDANTAPGVAVVDATSLANLAVADPNVVATPSVQAGTATFSYVVTNTGTTRLDPVRVTDDKLGAITCPATSLAAGASMVCTATGPIPVGQYTNTGTAAGTPPRALMPDGTVQQPADVTSSDPANVFVPTPALTVTKKVDGPLVDNGDHTYTLKYLVTVSNAGQVATSYNLEDKLAFGGNATITAATAVNTAGGIPIVAGWNGLSATELAHHAPIAPAAVHTYEVTVTARITTHTQVVPGDDCTLDSTESGTGLLNGAKLTVGGSSTQDTACVPIPTSGPLPITGSNLVGGLLLAAASLAAGGLLLVVVRRRRRLLTT